MYYPIIRQCIQALKNLETWLDKAEQHAAAKGFDVGVLLTSRLAPDMKDFIYQVQSACDYTKGAAAWLSGQKPPRHEDSEQTIDEVRARIRKTVDFAESVKEAQYAGASERRISLSWGHGKMIGGEDYLLQVVVQDIYFHVSIAYAILRHNGVDIGVGIYVEPRNSSLCVPMSSSRSPRQRRRSGGDRHGIATCKPLELCGVLELCTPFVYSPVSLFESLLIERRALA